MKLNGLTRQEVEQSRSKYGANTLTQIPPDPLWAKILAGFKDPMIMILLVALVVQVILFFLHQAEWFEPVGILIAILIANGVSSVSESRQEGKASALKAEEEAKETAKVLRDGVLSEIHVSEVVVGDIIFLQAGLVESKIVIPTDDACSCQYEEDQPAQAAALILRFGFRRFLRFRCRLFNDHGFRLRFRFLFLLQKFFQVIFIDCGQHIYVIGR